MVCDLLIKNGAIYTMDDGIPYAEWVAVADGKILALGMGDASYIEAKSVIDLKGKVVLPGLIDSHMHGTATGEALNAVDVAPANCVQDVIDLRPAN